VNRGVSKKFVVGKTKEAKKKLEKWGAGTQIAGLVVGASWAGECGTQKGSIFDKEKFAVHTLFGTGIAAKRNP